MGVMLYEQKIKMRLSGGTLESPGNNMLNIKLFK